LVESLVDPDAKIREACSKMSIRILRDLADSIYLDFDPQAYYDLMYESITSFAFNGVSSALSDLGEATPFVNLLLLILCTCYKTHIL